MSILEIDYGHHNVLFEVPLSNGIYFGSHEGCFDVVDKKTNLVLSVGSICNCLEMIPQIVFMLSEVSGNYYSSYYCGHEYGYELLYSTAIHVWQYEGQPIELDFKSYQLCERCLCCMFEKNQDVKIHKLSDIAQNRIVFTSQWWNTSIFKKAREKHSKKQFSQIKSNSPSGRKSPSYKHWRENIIERDKVCQCCGGDKYLEVHHIFDYKNHESLRITPENGVALCKWCHKKYHSYYGKTANPLDFVEFLHRFGVDFK